MIVYAPSRLLAALTPLLALRGVRTCGDPAVATAWIAAEPPPRAMPWLALAQDEAGAVAALERGAADVVTPEAGPMLIAARAARLGQGVPIVVGDLVLDPVTRAARRDGRALDLLPREFAVLLHLARQAGRIVTRSELHATVLGRAFDPGTNVVEVHVSRLRAQLDRRGSPMLLTERGRGYRLVVPAVAEVALAS